MMIIKIVVFKIPHHKTSLLLGKWHVRSIRFGVFGGNCENLCENLREGLFLSTKSPVFRKRAFLGNIYSMPELVALLL